MRSCQSGFVEITVPREAIVVDSLQWRLVDLYKVSQCRFQAMIVLKIMDEPDDSVSAELPDRLIDVCQHIFLCFRFERNLTIQRQMREVVVDLFGNTH